MGYALSESLLGDKHPTRKNRVWRFSGESNKTHLANQPQAPELRRKNRPSATKTVSGVRYYGYRYYDPVTGRWPSRDPIKEQGGINLYGFLRNSAVNSVDILGQKERACSGYDKYKADADSPTGYLGRTKEQNDVKFVIGPDPDVNNQNACGEGDFDIAEGWPVIFGGKPIVRFTGACFNHDQCYQTCGKTKKECDKEFLDDMVTLCGKVAFIPGWYAGCVAQAALYHAAVANSEQAKEGFEGSQDYHCKWECCEL